MCWKEQVQEELSKAQADRLVKQARFELSLSAAADDLPEANESSLRNLREQLTELRRKRAELITTYTENHSSVKKIDSQIAPLEAAAGTERRNVVNRIRNEYDGAVRREKLLTAKYEAQSKLVSDDAAKAIQYRILQRQVASNQQLYDAMLQRSKEATMAAGMRATAVRVIDAAKVPRAPYLPSLPLNLGLGFMSALCLAGGVVAIRVRTERALHGPGHAAAILNVSELGVIPMVPQNSASAVLGVGDLRRLPNAKVKLRLTGAAASSTSHLLAGLEDNVLQSFRGVLTSIFAAGAERPQIVVITSVNPAEGKTTVTGNLARVLAETGARVLVIDGDLHNPRIHRVFNLPNDRGLTNALAHEELTYESISGFVQQTPLPRLSVMTAGPMQQPAGALLYSPALPALLECLREHFDTILVDSPPMRQIADARVLGRAADGIVLVTKADATTIDEIVAVRQRLTDDGTHVLGTVLNGWRAGRAGYYRYGSYSGRTA